MSELKFGTILTSCFSPRNSTSLGFMFRFKHQIDRFSISACLELYFGVSRCIPSNIRFVIRLITDSNVLLDTAPADSGNPAADTVNRKRRERALCGCRHIFPPLVAFRTINRTSRLRIFVSYHFFAIRFYYL